MDTIKRNKLLQTLSLVLLLGLLWCCSDESVNDIPTTGSEESVVTFSVKVPSAGTPKTTGPKTYALSEADENEVTQIAVLLFDSDGNYTYQPIFCASNNITSDPLNSQLKSFTVRVPEGTYDMVVLANSNQSLNDVLSTVITGQPKATVLNKLLLSKSTKWDATRSSSNYIPIPMWGEAMGVSVSGNISAKTTVKLARMVAKIDVSLSSSIAKEKFNLQSVRLYNYNNQGQIVPSAFNWNNDASAVIAPSVPTLASKVSTPLVYDGLAITSDAGGRGVSVMNEIYTFEAALGNKSTLLTNTCLVVGGIYTGDTQTTYYRIDIANSVGASFTYLPLLRNHNYKVNIANVKASGMSTPDDAFKSGPANIEASIINWSDAEITHIAFDGQNMLGVSQAEFTFSRNEHTSASYINNLSVTTDSPSGWKIDKIVDVLGSNISWLDASIKTGVSGATTKTKLTMSENNTSSTRTGYIHLSAGRLSYIVKVEQLHTLIDSDTGSLSFIITDADGNLINELEFATDADVQPAQQQFILNWSATLPLSFSKTSGGRAFVFATSEGSDQIPESGILSNSIGAKTYTICPPAISSADIASDPFYERVTTFTYTISDGFTSIDKKFTLRQFSFSVLPVVDDIYKNDALEKSFGIRSTTPFTLSVKSDPNNLISLRSTSGPANTSTEGARIEFDVLSKVIFPESDVVITISSPTGLFPDQDFTLSFEADEIQPESNSYMLEPNGDMVVIPVSRVNKSMLGTQLSANEVFTAELVWTDNENGVAYNSNIRSIEVEGVGPSGYVVVRAGWHSGNAVVAVKNSSGKILWSWHIWVIQGNMPVFKGTYNFMDRNLGALDFASGKQGAKGLLYQWGRKDPIPGSVRINFTDEPTLYTPTGTISVSKEAVAVDNNFGNSVANPTTFYYSNSAPYDWYTKSGSQNDNLWNQNPTKSVYDPCPPGWRISQHHYWGGLTRDNFPWNNATHNRYHTNVGGYYPAAGYRKHEDGNLKYVDSSGDYWSDSVTGTEANHMTFSSSEVYFKANKRAAGESIRCVKDL